MIAVLAVALVGYVLAAGYLFVFQRDYVFKPGGALATPERSGLPQARIVTIRAKDGTALTGWFEAAAPGRPTILYFHGNAGNISDRANRFRQVVASGFGFLAMSYRGYPGSGGAPSETALFSDGLEIFDWLAAETPDIVIYGESLGTAVATHVATLRSGRVLVLEAPFTAARDIAAVTYPWLPVSWLMRDPFVMRDAIAAVKVPLLVVHGTHDEVVPVEEGDRLFALANEPKQRAVIDGAGHGDLWDHGLWPIVLGFLRNENVAGTP